MLAGVLLHMVEAALPVDFAVDGASGDFRGCVMHHAVSIGGVSNFDDRNTGKSAEIVGLAAGSGIESSAIESDFEAVAFALAGSDRGVKFFQE